MGDRVSPTAIEALPFRSADEAFASCRRAVVVAPHPDDETLGCGGAIARLRLRSVPVHVLVISDGTASHPNSKQYPPAKLRDLRERETRIAVGRLGGADNAVTFCRWPDKGVPEPGTQEFAIAVTQCHEYLHRHTPSVVFVPWRHDQHRDHRATWHIVQACLQSWSQPPQQIVYSIWGSPSAGLPMLPVGETGWRLDISSVESTKRFAVMAHQSQVTSLIEDDPEGFRLTSEMLANLIQPWETYLDVQ
jgi:LmbE family N-acetylglucosaminyl deacetylase